MNSALIKNWNDSIAEDDIVIFCGDFCFARTATAKEVTERFTQCLHGKKIIIKGNHDFKKFRYTECGWKAEFYQLFDFGRFLFCHRPDMLTQWHNDYDFVFFGHVHDKMPAVTYINTINVCLDYNNFQPLDITNYFTAGEIEKLKEIVNYENNK